MGEAKYARSSFCAIARTLLMGGLLAGLFGRERQEDLLEAQAHGPELQKAPAPADHGARELAPHVMALRAGDLEHAVARPVGRRHARDAGDTLEHFARFGHASAVD